MDIIMSTTIQRLDTNSCFAMPAFRAGLDGLCLGLQVLAWTGSEYPLFIVCMFSKSGL